MLHLLNLFFYISYLFTIFGFIFQYRWQADKFDIASGRDSGPLALFNQGNDVIFISPFNNFMAASGYHNKKLGSYGWGIMGGVTEVPKTFTLKTMLYYGDQGISQVQVQHNSFL